MFIPNTNGQIGFYSNQIHERYQRRLEQMEKAHLQEIRALRIRQDRRIAEERNATYTRHSEEAGQFLSGEEIPGVEQAQEQERLLDRQEKLGNKTLAGGD